MILFSGLYGLYRGIFYKIPVNYAFPYSSVLSHVLFGIICGILSPYFIFQKYTKYI